MEFKSLVNGFKLDYECIKVLSKYNASVLSNRTSSDYISMRNELFESVKKFNIQNISAHNICDLYITQHTNFLQKKNLFDESKKAKVIGKNHGTCQFPECNFIGSLEKDHILPKSSYTDSLSKFFDEHENSLLICKIHNQSFKGGSIGIGLALRCFLI